MNEHLAGVEATQKTLLSLAKQFVPPAMDAAPIATGKGQVSVQSAQGGLIPHTHESLDGRGELVMPFNFHCVGTFSAHTGPVWQIAARENFMFTTGRYDGLSSCSF
jgi:hypothetical protein